MTQITLIYTDKKSVFIRLIRVISVLFNQKSSKSKIKNCKSWQKESAKGATLTEEEGVQRVRAASPHPN
jgi:hypothetical protein